MFSFQSRSCCWFFSGRNFLSPQKKRSLKKIEEDLFLKIVCEFYNHVGLIFQQNTFTRHLDEAYWCGSTNKCNWGACRPPRFTWGGYRPSPLPPQYVGLRPPAFSKFDGEIEWERQLIFRERHTMQFSRTSEARGRHICGGWGGGAQHHKKCFSNQLQAI